jgi:photosystem II stability/assembly factor-like uncharacterized protein
MMVSHDAGKTWHSQSMSDNCKMLFDVHMIDHRIGLACAATDEDISKSHALILRTVDGGEHWSKVYESARPFETSWKVSFPDDLHGFASIQTYNPDSSANQQIIIKTNDGGVNWKEIALVKDIKAREFGIGFVDPMHGYVGTMDSGFETFDGGENWRKIDLGRACNKIRIYQDEKGIYGYAIGVNVFKLE